MNDVVPFVVLVPGERFTKEHVPHVVYSKTSHTWAHLNWKGRRSDTPMHPTDLVRRTTSVNPGEIR